MYIYMCIARVSLSLNFLLKYNPKFAIPFWGKNLESAV